MEIKIITKELDNGDIIYTVEVPLGTRLQYPIGYFKTEAEAIEAYNKSLIS